MAIKTTTKSTAKTVAPKPVTPNNSKVATPVKAGSSSEKAGIIGYNSGGGAIYGAAGGQNFSPTNATSKYASAVKDTQAGFPTFASEQVDNTGDVTAKAQQTVQEAPMAQMTQESASPVLPTPADAQGPTEEMPKTAEPLSSVTTVATQNIPTNKFKAGFEQARQQGVPQPTTPGQGRATVANYVAPEQPKSNAQQFIDTDPVFSELMTSFRQQMEPQTQRKSLASSRKLFRMPSNYNIHGSHVHLHRLFFGRPAHIYQSGCAISPCTPFRRSYETLEPRSTKLSRCSLNITG